MNTVHHKTSLREKLGDELHDIEKKIEDVIYEKWHVRLHKKAKHHVHKLRKLPDHHKEIIAFSVAFLFTCMVFVLWYYVSFPKIVNSYKIQKKENAALGRSGNPLADIKARLEYPEYTDSLEVQP